METMASGALVLVDKMATPRPFALLHNKHVVYYGKSTEIRAAYEFAVSIGCV